MSKVGYYADFVVYPVLIAAFAVRSMWHATLAGTEFMLGAIIIGHLAWTALEYILHRWVLHGVAPFMRLHALHHEHPAALIGTPTWLSAGLFFGLWIALGREVPVPIADGLVAGLMAGYLFYAVVHDAVHHRRARSGSWLHRAKRRHAQHHRAGPAAEFGVSTPLWDSVFGTRSRCLPRQGTALPTEA